MVAIHRRANLPWLKSFVVLLLLCTLPEGVTRAQVKPVRRVLILNEVNTTHPGIQLIEEGIRAAFDNSPYKTEFYREYLDTIYFPDEADQQQFRAFYIHKYQNRRPDVIITVGPSPLKFMSEMHQAAFPGVPIVFCLPHWLPEPLVLDHDFTGVENDMAPLETVEAALHLQPGTKHVVVVGGSAFIDRQFEEVVKKQLGLLRDNLDISYFTNLAMPDLLERLKRLPNQTIVLFTSFSRDATGTKFISGAEAGPMIVTAANAPVFSLADVSLNHGEVGGKLSYLREQGRSAGNIVLRILGGEKPQDIPWSKAGTTYIFDSRALKHWGFKESNLPPGSIVLNRRPTAWELYKWYIVGGLCLLLVQTSLIVGLLWQRVTRRKAEAARRESEDRFAGIVGTAMDAIIAIDEEQRIVLFNAAAEKMFGCPGEQAFGTTIDRFIPERFRRKHAEHVQGFRRAGITSRLMSSRGVLWGMRTNGEEFPIEASISQTESGGKKTFTVIIRDIRERLQVETAIRESEERFRLVANTAPVMIWMSGTDKLCNYFNKPWLDFTGRSLEQERGNGWTDGVHNEDLAGCLQTYTEAFDKREQFEMQYRLRRHDGEYRWVSDIGVPRFNNDCTFAGYIGSCIDVTERKRAEEAMSTMGRRLIEAHEEERTRIGRELHDDVNQRLALLAIELDNLGKDDSRLNFSQHVRSALSRIMEISKDVQALSHRLHSSKLEYLGLVRAAKSFCRELSEQAKVEIQFYHSAVPSTLPKEASLCLFRVLQEALQNAIKYSGVTLFDVNLHGTPDSVKLTVSDHGKGFDEYEAYSRQGLGLISMRERLQMAHGVFELKTRPGAGTTISARIPLHTAKIRTMAG